jgi:hypothetical protein
MKNKSKVETRYIPVIVSIIASLATILVSLFGLIPSLVSTLPTPTSIPQSVSTQIASMQSEIAILKQDVNSLSQVISTTTPNQSPDIVVINANLESLDKRLSTIEQAVLDNPSRALELTLLSRDMDTLKETYQSDLANTRAEIERIYSFNQWFLGGVITLSLAVISLALSNFLKRPGKSKPGGAGKSEGEDE